MGNPANRGPRFRGNKKAAVRCGFPGRIFRRLLLVLVFVNALADAVLLAVDAILFRLGQVAVVFRHVFLLAILNRGFPLLEIRRLLRVQRSVLHPVGDTILLVLFALVDLVNARMAGINYTRARARSGAGGLGSG
jgi:hypothetical protein